MIFRLAPRIAISKRIIRRVSEQGMAMHAAMGALRMHLKQEWDIVAFQEAEDPFLFRVWCMVGFLRPLGYGTPMADEFKRLVEERFVSVRWHGTENGVLFSINEPDLVLLTLGYAPIPLTKVATRTSPHQVLDIRR